MNKVPSNNNNFKKSAAKIKEFLLKMAKIWLPVEERKKEKVVQGNKTKFPITLQLAIAVITFSLFMIVGSSVLLGSAQNEQNELEDKIAKLDLEISELRTDLDKKNAEAEIEKFAKEELGMIGQEYVNFEYINSNKTDEFEKQKDEKVSFGSLLRWIFQQVK
jgi:cell division protein FtsB